LRGKAKQLLKKIVPRKKVAPETQRSPLAAAAGKRIPMQELPQAAIFYLNQ
jgi:hypothetical protein